MIEQIPISNRTLKQVAALDHLRGAWEGGRLLPADRLRRLKHAAQLQSVTAACRMAGIHIDEAEVAALLGGDAVPFREGREVIGYVAAMDEAFPATGGPLVSATDVAALHALAHGAPGNPAEPTPWREQHYHLEVFDTDGRATGRVFQTLPQRLIPDKMNDLLTWLELELREQRNHPIPVIAVFILYFVAICPFPRGNGRVSHLLGHHLLQRVGYDFVPYASLERIFEDLRPQYFEALDAAQTRLWSGEADLEPWLNFYLDALEKHARGLQVKIDVEQRSMNLTPLQRKILDTVREHGTVGAGVFLETTGSNRNTLKDNLRRMVDMGLLERMGERRGTRYRLSAAVPAPVKGPGPETAD